MSSRRTLSVESLESRLNLSTLGGLTVPLSLEVPIRAEERITLPGARVLSLREAVRQSPTTELVAAGGKVSQTALAAPANLTATASSTSVFLQWADKTSTESGFRVFRSADGVSFTQIASLGKNKTTFSDTGVQAGKTYSYYVTAYTSTSVSPASNVAKAIVPAPVVVTVPTSPTGLAATSVTDTSVTLGWADSATNETGYRVYRSTDGTNFTLAGNLGANATTFTDSSLTASTGYTYRVAAYNSAGEAGATVSATTQAPAPVVPPEPTTNPVTIGTKFMTSFTELRIDGTSGNDSIAVSQANGVLTITTNGQTSTYANTFGDLVITGLAGDDTITVDSSVNIATLIYGGDGNNTLRNFTTGKATIVGIGNGVNTVLGNGINTAYWVNASDTVSASALESSLGGINRVGNFYQPWGATAGSTDYVSRDLYGQDLKDPTDSGATRRLTANSFFGTGPTMNDVNQGSVGDCYFLAPLASLSYSEPQRLTNMAVDFGDGTYGFRFVRNGVANFVRVDGDLPTGPWSGGVAYGHPGASGNQWAPLFEKAYAFYRSGANTYASIGWGFQNTAMSDLGLANSYISAGSGATTIEAKINDSLANGKAVAANTNSTVTSGVPVVASHVYSVIGTFRDSAGTLMLKLRNPWGTDGAGNDGLDDGIVTVSYAQFAANFNVLSYSLT